MAIDEFGSIGIICGICHSNARLAVADTQPNIWDKGVASCHAALKAVHEDVRKVVVEV